MEIGLLGIAYVFHRSETQCFTVGKHIVSSWGNTMFHRSETRCFIVVKHIGYLRTAYFHLPSKGISLCRGAYCLKFTHLIII